MYCVMQASAPSLYNVYQRYDIASSFSKISHASAPTCAYHAYPSTSMRLTIVRILCSVRK